jgi:ATP-dependent DNA helicase RecG
MNFQSPVDELPQVGSSYTLRLKKLGITTVKDLLFHLPHRYLDYSRASVIKRARVGETVTLLAKIVSLKNQYTKAGRKMQIGQVEDESGKITVVWFNQPFLVRSLYPGVTVSLAGKIGWFGRVKALVSPEYEILRGGGPAIHTKGIVPIYPETSGLSSKWLRSRILKTLSVITKPEEYLPKNILTTYGLPPLSEALQTIHFPDELNTAKEAYKRLAFEELLSLHLTSLKRKKSRQRHSPYFKIEVPQKEVDNFINKLPFVLTAGQQKAVGELLSDMQKDYPMNRLLEGDVGSGKTIVAAIGAFVAFLNGYQTVIMAPTQILAQQHFNTLGDLFKAYKIRVGLITSEVVKKDLGRIDIYVGTHALIHKKINFDKVALVVIDEQHRFGVEQRAHLVKKIGRNIYSPHTLTMTATPIPRTVALTAYGDLDLSLLSELPPGRLKVATWVITPAKREKAFEWVAEKIKRGKAQVFVVCPLIEESAKETMLSVRAATKEFAELKTRFRLTPIGLLHGRLKAKEKDEVLSAFKAGKIKMLVSTPVVEVGIDMPKATIMVIEGAERFGLATLHQLRGRVGRGQTKSYCLILPDSKALKVATRLKALEKGLSGFELAELDLKLRGPGEIFGTAQHGFPELTVASWQDAELIKDSRDLAESIFKQKDLLRRVDAKNCFLVAGSHEIV